MTLKVSFKPGISSLWYKKKKSAAGLLMKMVHPGSLACIWRCMHAKKKVGTTNTQLINVFLVFFLLRVMFMKQPFTKHMPRTK